MVTIFGTKCLHISLIKGNIFFCVIVFVWVYAYYPSFIFICRKCNKTNSVFHIQSFFITLGHTHTLKTLPFPSLLRTDTHTYKHITYFPSLYFSHGTFKNVEPKSFKTWERLRIFESRVFIPKDFNLIHNRVIAFRLSPAGRNPETIKKLWMTTPSPQLRGVQATTECWWKEERWYPYSISVNLFNHVRGCLSGFSS